MVYDIFDSPIGKLTVVSNGRAVTALHIEGDRYFAGVAKEWRRDGSDWLLIRTQKELDEYFSGKRTVFDIPVVAHGTEFQRAVWKEVAKIPFGTSMSYGDIATKLGKPKAVRAVGTAVGRNPVCLIVPCHRVLTSSGGYGGYVAGVDRKQQLLSHEGIDAR